MAADCGTSGVDEAGRADRGIVGGRGIAAGQV